VTSEKYINNSRLIFVNMIGHARRFGLNMNEATCESLYFECEYNEEFLQKLRNSYDTHHVLINEYIHQNPKLAYELDKVLVCAACCELIKQNCNNKNTINQYIGISDRFGGMTSVIHAILSNFVVSQEESQPSL
jgi:hypothetical protein